MIRIVQAATHGLLAILVGLAFCEVSVGAEEGFDWLDKSQGFSSVETKEEGLEARNCTQLEVDTIDKRSESVKRRSLCINYGKNIKSGYSDDGRSYLSINNSVFYLIPLWHYDRVVTVPNTDKLIFDLSGIHTSGRSLLIYDSYQEGLKESDDEWFYRPNYDNPKFINGSERGGFGLMTYGISENGRFLAYSQGGSYGYYGEVRLLDLDSGEIRSIGREGYNYTYSPMPAPSYAVSNDGQWIVEGGHSLKVWNTNMRNCRDSNEYREGFGYDTCRYSMYGWESFNAPAPTRDYYYINNLKLNNNATNLSFSFNGYSNSSLTVSIEAPGYTAPEGQLDYLALGDSYSSGEGDIESSGQFYLLGTEGRGQCHLSGRSYPYMLRDHYRIPANKMASVACSGAQVVFDYIGVSDVYLGQSKQLENVKEAARVRERQEALDNFRPGIIKQLDFVRRYQPKTVTFTGGGNDVGFAEILKYCAQPVAILIPYTCEYAKDGSLLNTMLYDSIDTQYTYTKMLISAIRESSPDSKIIIIGYPSFISEEGGVCYLNGASLNHAEKVFINSAVNYMNKMLQSVAYNMGVGFVDIEDSLRGGRICEDISNNSYVNGLLNVGPARIFTAGVGESFHPNYKGHQRIAQVIIDSMELEFTNAVSSSTYEPNENAINTQRIDMIERDQSKSGGLKAVIKGAFKPNSTIRASLHSDPIDLGPVVANRMGDVKFSINTDEAPLGNHLLILEGVGVNNEPVRYYQFIEIFEKESVLPGDNESNSDADTDNGKQEINSKINRKNIFNDGSTQNISESVIGIQQKSLLAYGDKDDTASDVATKVDHGNSNSYGAFVNDETQTGSNHIYLLVMCAILVTGAVFYAKKYKKT